MNLCHLILFSLFIFHIFPFFYCNYGQSNVVACIISLIIFKGFQRHTFLFSLFLNSVFSDNFSFIISQRLPVALLGLFPFLDNTSKYTSVFTSASR